MQQRKLLQRYYKLLKKKKNAEYSNDIDAQKFMFTLTCESHVLFPPSTCRFLT